MNKDPDSLVEQYLSNAAAPVLWIADDGTARSLLDRIAPRAGLEVLSNRWDLHRALDKRGFRTHINDFEFDTLPQNHFATIVYPVSKERPLVHHCINHAHRLLHRGGQLVLLGEKNQGIKTHCKHARQVFDSDVEIRKQGTTYVGTLSKVQDQAATHLNSNDYAQLREMHAPKLSFWTKPGIFGWNKIDHGSALLMDQVGQLLDSGSLAPANVLDLGCGWGYLTMMLRGYNIPQCTATDNNPAAVKAAKKNFARHKLEVTVTLDDCGSQLPGGFDCILCNPPFHQGFNVSGDLTDNFIRQTHRLLHKDGTALFVVNQFVGLEKLAGSVFERVEVVRQLDGFKIIQLGKTR